MKRHALTLLTCFALAAVAPSLAFAQPSAPASASATGSASTRAAPTPPPVPVEQPALPPGHPPVGPAGVNAPPGERTLDDPGLPPSTVAVEAEGLPPGTLRSLEASIAVIRRTGDDVSVQTRAKARLDATGKARFDGLESLEDELLRVTIVHEGVPYASPVFKLHDRAGKKVTIRLFDVTEDIDQARVGVWAFVYVEPRDHHLHVEQMFRFANLSELTWQAGTTPVRLPPSAQNLTTRQQSGPLSVSAVPGQGVVVQGVVPPGAAEVSFQYQVPYPDDEVARFELGMPPRVGAVRVMASMGPGLSLHAEGLPPAAPSRNDRGQRLLMTESAVPPGGDQIEHLRLALGGLPSTSYAHLVALGLTLFAMAFGLVGSLYLRRESGRVPRGKANQARRDTLLAALAGLETRLAKHEIDEHRYAIEKDVLLDDLARSLEASAEPVPRTETDGDNHGDKT